MEWIKKIFRKDPKYCTKITFGSDVSAEAFPELALKEYETQKVIIRGRDVFVGHNYPLAHIPYTCTECTLAERELLKGN